MRLTKEERKRLQFLENFRAWSKVTGAPLYTLLPHVAKPVRPDRILFYSTDEWRKFFLSKVFVPWDTAIAEHAPLGRKTAFRGFREDTPFAALQAVLHIDPYFGVYVEADFDVGNPAEGLLPLLVHGGEYVWYRLPRLFGRKTKLTSPFFIRRLLRRRGIEARKV